MTRSSPLVSLSDDEKRYFAILETLEAGDQDGQPWAFYEHDHGGLRGFDWSKENAMTERINFAHAVRKRLKEEFSE